jgi:hypothetical protein
MGLTLRRFFPGTRIKQSCGLDSEILCFGGWVDLLILGGMI